MQLFRLPANTNRGGGESRAEKNKVATDFHFAVSQADTHARACETHVFAARTSMNVDQRSPEVDWSEHERSQFCLDGFTVKGLVSVGSVRCTTVID